MSTEPSVFTRIINREIPAEIIYEDEHCVVLPDKFPSMAGQVVVVPKKQVAYIAELDDASYMHLMQVVKRTMTALDRGLGTVRTCIIVEGFELPHVHIRLYPCLTPELILDGRYEATNEELVALATTLRPYFI